MVVGKPGERNGGRVLGALAPLLAVLFIVLPALAATFSLMPLGLADRSGEPIGLSGLFAFLLLPFALTALVVLAWSRVVERRSLAAIGLPPSIAVATFLRGWGLGLAGIAFVVIASWAVGGYTAVSFAAAFGSAKTLAAIAGLGVAFAVQSSAEEVLFRGWLLTATRQRFNSVVAVTIVTAIFTLLHYDHQQAWLTTINLALFSLFACAWVLATGNVWGAMGWHSGWNWLQAIGFAVPVTGLDTHLPALLVTLDPTGPACLTGGAQGPEGSLFCTVFFVVGIAVFIRKGPARAAAHRPPG
jgi:membrane protease YdiL (CAAX protease family)